MAKHQWYVLMVNKSVSPQHRNHSIINIVNMSTVTHNLPMCFIGCW